MTARVSKMVATGVPRFIIGILFMLAPLAALAGTWGAGSFENDDAVDWVVECVRSDDIASVERALHYALKAEYIEAREGAVAIAAAEVVAASLGNSSAEFPQELREWMERQQSGKLAQFAPIVRRALMRIEDAEVSELQQLWSKAGSDEWRAAMTELAERLGN